MESNIQKTLTELVEINHALVNSVRIKQAEIGVLRNQVQALTGEVIKCQQDSAYAAGVFVPS